MPRISKVRWPEMGQDYGWLFEIKNYSELQDYWDNVRLGKAQNDFREAMKYVESRAHANVLVQLAELKGISLIDALTNLNERIGKGMSSALDDHGIIFINDLGGYFAVMNGIVVDESKEIDVWALPGKEPRFIQWPGGKHYYAKIGDEDIVVNGKQKWSTLKEAKAAAEKYMKGRRR